MSDDIPILAHPVEVRVDPPHDMPTPPAALVQTPEQMQAIDAAFARSAEADFVAGMLLLWTSTPCLLSLAREHFHTDENEERADNAEEEPVE